MSRFSGRGWDPFHGHLVASFTKRLTTYGIQSGVAAVLGEDLRYKPSQSRNVWKRSQHALFSTIAADTPRGKDVAYANFVAAIGSGLIISTYHPGWQAPHHPPGAIKLASRNLIGFAEANLWKEFKPDIKHLVRSKVLHRK